MRRTRTAPTNPLKWDLPGGAVEFGEDPLISILREIKEETGLRVRAVTPIDIEGHINQKGKYKVTLAYTASDPQGKLSISWEHDLYRWVTIDEYLKMKTTKKLKKFARNLKNKKILLRLIAIETR